MLEEIHFQDGSISDEDKKIKFKFGDMFQFEFIKGELTPVYFLNVNSQIGKYIKQISKDHTIFVDFNFVPNFIESKGAPPPRICIFTFCCTSGVFVFKQTSPKPNQLLKKFLSEESGHEFIGFSLQDSVDRMKEMFGDDFSINIEDTRVTRLRPINIGTIGKLCSVYGSDLLVQIKNTKLRRKYWNARFLKFELLVFTASWSFVISHCYKKFPAKNENENILSKSENDKIPPKIKKQKKDVKVKELTKDWKIGETRSIQLFRNFLTKVCLLDADKDFERFTSVVSKSSLISIDFRFFSLDFGDKHYTSSFTFGTNSKVYFFIKSEAAINNSFEKFLSSKNGFKFIGKETTKTVENFKKLFGENFEIDIIDIDLDENFKKMSKNFHKEYKKKNKEKKIKKSDLKNEMFYNCVAKILSEPCEKLHQYRSILWTNKSNVMEIIKKSAIWTSSILKIYKKINKIDDGDDDDNDNVDEEIERNNDNDEGENDEFEYDTDDDDDDSVVVVDKNGNKDSDDEIVVDDNNNDNNESDEDDVDINDDDEDDDDVDVNDIDDAYEDDFV